MSRSALHLFSLPQELLETLTPRNSLLQDRAPSPDLAEKPAETAQTTSGSRSCNICLGAVFTDVDDQRSHFRSDWHRYNVKARLAGGKVVSESDFFALVEGLDIHMLSKRTSI